MLRQVAQRGYVMESGTITLLGAAKELLGSDVIQRAFLRGVAEGIVCNTFPYLLFYLDDQDYRLNLCP